MVEVSGPWSTLEGTSLPPRFHPAIVNGAERLMGETASFITNAGYAFVLAGFGEWFNPCQD